MTGGETPRVSIVVPAYNEGDQIVPVLDRLFESVHLQCEVLVVVDDEADTTVPVVTEYALKEPRIRCLVNTYGSGPANAIRFGTDAAAAAVTVVTMADGCDDPRQIDDLARLVDRGVAIAAASRYMPGGQQVGGPLMKGFPSKTATSVTKGQFPSAVIFNVQRVGPSTGIPAGCPVIDPLPPRQVSFAAHGRYSRADSCRRYNRRSGSRHRWWRRGRGRSDRAARSWFRRAGPRARSRREV